MQTKLTSIINQDPARETSRLLPQADSELIKEGYKTDDKVYLEGGLHRGVLKKVRISGTPPIYLNTRQFLVWLVLGCHNLSIKKAIAPFSIETGPFIKASQILEAIDRIKALAGFPIRAFEYAIDADVTRVIATIRVALRKNRNNPNLIEKGPYGFGYRLSTRPRNVHISYIRHTGCRMMETASHA